VRGALVRWRLMERRARCAVLCALCLLCAACDAESGTGSDSDAGTDAGTDAGSETGLGELPDFSDAELAALAALRYDDGPPPADPSNRVADDPAARQFGQRLFFDAALSGPLIDADNDGGAATLGHVGEAGRVSCAGCHVPEHGFVDTRSPHQQISLAAQWTSRRTPTLLEIGFAPLYNWDGRRDSLWNQAIGVMESEQEFNAGRLFVAEQVFRLHRAEYEAIFGALPALDDAARFPQLAPEQAGCVEQPTRTGPIFVCRGRPGDGADYDGLSAEAQQEVTEVAVNAAKAMAAYLRLLRCGPSRFDAWLDGDADALDPAEQRGAQLFVGRGRCVGCHDGPNLSDGKFHNVGLAPAPVAVAFVDLDDRGAAEGLAAALTDPLGTAGAFSDGDRRALPERVLPEHDGAFRTPTLRCMNARPSFMHTGQIRTASQVVAFFNRGGDPPGNYPGTSELAALGPLALDERERADLVAFMAALEGPGPGAALRGAPP
jgi:cytochrome c peroxidase